MTASDLPMPDANQSVPWRRIVLSLWVISLAAATVLWFYPIGSRPIRVSQVGLCVLLWIGAVTLWWRRVGVRTLCFAVLAAVLTVVLWPSRVTDPAGLRAGYVESLAKYEGAPYLWGGENGLGIDCSGLVRRGLIDASLWQGLHTLNPGLVRQSMALRWFDCSAKALRDEFRGQTMRLFSAEGVHVVDHTRLQPGDFAVTAEGVHTLAYLGNHVWIEADPGAGQVIRLRASEDNPWLKTRVYLMRWRLLEGGLSATNHPAQQP
jgi:hypothetical protein